MSKPATRSPLTEDQFLDLLCTYFGLETGTTLDDRLTEDLGFDSLQYFELVAMLEDTGGHPVPSHVAAGLVTLRDVYETYVIYSGHRPSTEESVRAAG